MNNDLISRRVVKGLISDKSIPIKFEEGEGRGDWRCSLGMPLRDIYKAIDNAPTATEVEKPFITECRDKAIEKNLPLYFVYYDEEGILEVYVTETKELFEKRRCYKYLSNYEFKEAVIKYLDWYSAWRCSVENER